MSWRFTFYLMEVISFARSFVGATSNERRGCCTLILSTICLTGLTSNTIANEKRASYIGLYHKHKIHAHSFTRSSFMSATISITAMKSKIHSKQTHTHILWSHLWNLEICNKDCIQTRTQTLKKEFYNENSFLLELLEGYLFQLFLLWCCYSLIFISASDS